MAGVQAGAELYRAVFDNDLAAVKRLKHLHDCDYRGSSPLMVAAEKGFVRIARVLLQARANPNKARPDGVAPIHLAVASDVETSHDIVTLLCQAGVDATQHAWACPDVSLVDQAARAGNSSIVKALMRAKANLDPVNLDLNIALAERSGHDKVARLLSSEHKKYQDEVRQRRIYNAVYNGDEDELVGLLLDSPHSDVNLKFVQPDSGSSPLFVAAERGHVSILRRLIASGANVHQPRHDGYTPLRMAVARGQVGIVAILSEIPSIDLYAADLEQEVVALECRELNDSVDCRELNDSVSFAVEIRHILGRARKNREEKVAIAHAASAAAAEGQNIEQERRSREEHASRAKLLAAESEARLEEAKRVEKFLDRERDRLEELERSLNEAHATAKNTIARKVDKLKRREEKQERVRERVRSLADKRITANCAVEAERQARHQAEDLVEELEEQVKMLRMQLEQRGTSIFESKTSASETDLESMKSKASCVLCLDAPREYALLPCGHLALCQGCSVDFLKSGKSKKPVCPLCRHPMNRLQRVFTS